MTGYLRQEQLDYRVMLKKGNKIIAVTLVVLLFSCGERNNIMDKHDDLKTYRDLTFESYRQVYNTCKDSVSRWVRDSLQQSQSLFYYDWQLDSVMVFNSDSNRFFTTVNLSCKKAKNSIADNIQEFGGARIGNKWYFFPIARSMVVPRGNYRDDEYEPFTFDELSYIAHEEIIWHYITRRVDGTFVSNDSAFKKLFFDEWYCGNRPCQDTQEIDSIILLNARESHKFKLKPQEIRDVNLELLNTKRPLEPKKWWQFW